MKNEHFGFLMLRAHFTFASRMHFRHLKRSKRLVTIVLLNAQGPSPLYHLDGGIDIFDYQPLRLGIKTH